MDHVHIGWLADKGELKQTLIAHGVSVSQDLAVNPGANGLSIAFVSAGADLARAEVLLRGALEAGARLGVATMGELGSLASDGRHRASAGAVPVHVVDTTGAGDSFIAGFLAAHVAGRPLERCLVHARDAAAMTCTHFGGFIQELQSD